MKSQNYKTVPLQLSIKVFSGNYVWVMYGYVFSLVVLLYRQQCFILFQFLFVKIIKVNFNFYFV